MEWITLTAEHGRIALKSGVHFNDPDFYDSVTGRLKGEDGHDDILVEATPDYGYTFDHIEVVGDDGGNEYVSVDDNGVVTFHICGHNECAPNSYFGDITVVFRELTAEEIELMHQKENNVTANAGNSYDGMLASANETLSALIGDIANADTEAKKTKAKLVAEVFNHKYMQGILAEA